jgi:cell division protein FtsL
MKMPRGRTIALILLGFVLVAAGVIARRTYGLQQARRLRDLERGRASLEAERLRVEEEIRSASSRGRLAPIAEQRLNMRVPSPDQVIILPREPRQPADSARAPR